MLEKILFGLCFFSALGCGLNAGLYFIFSNTIMGSLSRLKPDQGIMAMQHINRVILNPLFFVVFFGTAVTSLILAVSSIWRWQLPGAIYLLGGCVFYLIGSILVTIIFNVPMNETLDAAKPESIEAAHLWSNYLKHWTSWNHVRGIACLLGSALFTLALRNHY